MTCMDAEAVAMNVVLSSSKAKPCPDMLNEAVSTGMRQLMERYHQTHGVAIAKNTGGRERRSFDNSWNDEALSYFRQSAWEDVVSTCKKILDVPGQSESNYNALFQIGYASMRLGDYISAAENFLLAQCVDNRPIALRLAMLDLSIIFATKQSRKRTRVDALDEQRHVVIRTSNSSSESA